MSPRIPPERRPPVQRLISYDPEVMAARGRLGGLRTARTRDVHAAMAKARAAYQRQLEQRVDPDGALAPDERARKASALRRELARAAMRARHDRGHAEGVAE